MDSDRQRPPAPTLPIDPLDPFYNQDLADTFSKNSLDAAASTIIHIFSLPDGSPNPRLCHLFADYITTMSDNFNLFRDIISSPSKPHIFCHYSGRFHCHRCESSHDPSLNFCLGNSGDGHEDPLTPPCLYCEEQSKIIDNARLRVRTAAAVQQQKVIIHNATASVPLPLSVTATSPLSTLLPSVPPSIVPARFNRNGNFVDKFLAVTLTLSDTDLNNNLPFLRETLSTNFAKFTSIKNMPCLGWAYAFEWTVSGVPHLHGIVRLSVDLLKNKSISASDNNFQGRHTILINGTVEPRRDKLKMLLRPDNASRWINYIIKEFVPSSSLFGDFSPVISGWNYDPTISPLCPFL